MKITNFKITHRQDRIYSSPCLTAEMDIETLTFKRRLFFLREASATIKRIAFRSDGIWAWEDGTLAADLEVQTIAFYGKQRLKTPPVKISVEPDETRSV